MGSFVIQVRLGTIFYPESENFVLNVQTEFCYLKDKSNEMIILSPVLGLVEVLLTHLLFQ